MIATEVGDQLIIFDCQWDMQFAPKVKNGTYPSPTTTHLIACIIPNFSINF